MKRGASILLAGILLSGLPALAGGEIYGKITTTRGQTYTGPIRWDVNENFWDDRLDATKHETVSKGEDGYRFSLFGIKIGPGASTIRHAFSVPFGHLKAIEPLGGNEALVKLKSGDEFRVRGDGSSDLGSGLRKLKIEDAEEGVVELSWRSIAEVEFLGAPEGPGRDRQRLYGTVETRDGSLTGFLMWDRDESMLEDIIDGEDDEVGS